jgi:hypothetical protein
MDKAAENQNYMPSAEIAIYADYRTVLAECKPDREVLCADY